MQIKIEELTKQNTELVAQLQILQQAHSALQKENKLLLEKARFLLHRMFGKKSEKTDSRQLELLLDCLQPESPSPEDEPPPEPPSPPRSRSRKNKPRIPANLPTEDKIIVPDEVQNNPQDYKCIGEEITEELDVDPARYFMRRTIRRKYVSIKNKEQAPVIAPLQPRLIEGGYASAGLLTDIILQKYVDHLPLHRQERILKTRYGIDLSRKTMCDWVGKVADWLTPIYNHVKKEVAESKYVQVDESPVKYCPKDGTGGGQGYLWAFHHPRSDVLFEWHTSRAAECMESMLGGFKGTLQSDGYQAYKAFARKHENIILAACWAHARRKFFEAQDETKGLSRWLLHQIGLLYRIEAGLRETRAGPNLRLANRSAASKMVLRRIEKVLHKKLAAYLPQSRMGNAISYTLSLWNQLEQFCEDGKVEIDNNLVENAIRPTALGKKNWLFFGAAHAGQRSAIIYSLLESCRRRGINQREYLLDVLNRLPTMKITEVAELTPARWLAARKTVYSVA